MSKDLRHERNDTEVRYGYEKEGTVIYSDRTPRGEGSLRISVATV